MKNGVRIACLYTVFAIIASAINLVVQASVVFSFRGRYAVEISILIGTVASALIRYFFVKRHIFYFESKNIRHDCRLFLVYSMLGFFTTALFWGVEFGFQWFFGTDYMRYLGGAMGLAISYFVKYQLDKRFVFVCETTVSGRLV